MRLPCRPDEIMIHGILAQVHLRMGEAERARQAAEITLRHINAELAPSTFYSFEGYAGVPDVYLSLLEAFLNGEHSSGTQASLRKLARQACKGLRGYARVFPIARPRALICQGLYGWLRGNPRQAHKTWRKAQARAENLAMPYEQGLAHYEIGRHLPVDDPGRGEHLSRAVDIFSRLDAAWDLDRARQQSQLV